MRRKTAFAGMGAAAAVVATAHGQPCEAGWLDGFPMSDLNGAVRCMARFDEGSGPSLYVASDSMTGAGGVPVMSIARWDGSGWSAPGKGVMGNEGEPGTINAMTVADLGAGARLFVGGAFQRAGQVHAVSLAAWDGAAWAAVPGFSGRFVFAMCAGRLGGKIVLCIAADFSTGSSAPHYGVRSFDGTAWTTLGGAFASPPVALASYDNGSGSVLYAGGDPAGLAGTGPVACWNGASWEAVSAGEPDGPVLVLRQLDLGDGRALFVGGAFTKITTAAGPLIAGGIARLQSAGWSELVTPGELVGSAGAPIISSISGWASDSGPSLVLGGDVALASDPAARGVVARSGGAWSAVGAGFVGPVYAVESLGSSLYAAGEVIRAGAARVNHIARFDGSAWSTLDGGSTNSPSRFGNRNHYVISAARFDTTGGTKVYAAGQLRSFDDFRDHGLAVWDGASWATADDGGSERIWRLVVHNDGTGPAMYALGRFPLEPGEPWFPIARWDGLGWSKVGDIRTAVIPLGAELTLWSIARHDDGTGPKLFVAGLARAQSGGSTFFVARWDGALWTRISDSLPSTSTYSEPWELASTSGDNPKLFVAGLFYPPVSTDSSTAVAVWDGAAWSYPPGALANPGPQFSTTATTHNRELYVAGQQMSAPPYFGRVGAARLAGAKWDMIGPPLDPYFPSPWTIGWFDDGAGDALYVGGRLCCAEFLENPQPLVRFDGTTWKPFGGGVVGNVLDATVIDDGTGPALWVSGNLVRADGKPTHMIGRYRGCAGRCTADFNGDGFLDPLDYNQFINAFEANDVSADFDGNGLVDPLDYNGFINAFEAGC